MIAQMLLLALLEQCPFQPFLNVGREDHVLEARVQ